MTFGFGAKRCRINLPLCGPRLLNGNPYQSPTNTAGTTSQTTSPQIRRWSLGLSCALLNFAVWQVGIYLDRFGGQIDMFGAMLCRTSWFLAPLVIAATLLYSPIRRYALPVRSWDFYGPAISILAYVIMHWQSHLSMRY